MSALKNAQILSSFIDRVQPEESLPAAHEQLATNDETRKALWMAAEREGTLEKKADKDLIRATLRAYDYIDRAQWLQALRYAEQRLAPIEDEIVVLAKRLTGLETFMAAQRTAGLKASSGSTSALFTAQLLKKTPPTIPTVRNVEKALVMAAVKATIAMLVEKRILRTRCEEMLKTVLRDASSDGMLD